MKSVVAKSKLAAEDKRHAECSSADTRTCRAALHGIITPVRSNPGTVDLGGGEGEGLCN